MKFKEAKKYLDKGLKISSVKKDGYFEKVNDIYIRSVFYSDIGKVACDLVKEFNEIPIDDADGFEIENRTDKEIMDFVKSKIKNNEK